MGGRQNDAGGTPGGGINTPPPLSGQQGGGGGGAGATTVCRFRPQPALVKSTSMNNRAKSRKVRIINLGLEHSVFKSRFHPFNFSVEGCLRSNNRQFPRFRQELSQSPPSMTIVENGGIVGSRRVFALAIFGVLVTEVID